MLLRDLLDGVDLEGFIIVQCWEAADRPTIYYSGVNLKTSDVSDYLDREISCMFPYLNNQAAAFCIELES